MEYFTAQHGVEVAFWSAKLEQVKCEAVSEIAEALEPTLTENGTNSFSDSDNSDESSNEAINCCSIDELVQQLEDVPLNNELEQRKDNSDSENGERTNNTDNVLSSDLSKDGSCSDNSEEPVNDTRTLDDDCQTHSPSAIGTSASDKKDDDSEAVGAVGRVWPEELVHKSRILMREELLEKFRSICQVQNGTCRYSTTEDKNYNNFFQSLDTL